MKWHCIRVVFYPLGIFSTFPSNACISLHSIITAINSSLICFYFLSGNLPSVAFSQNKNSTILYPFAYTYFILMGPMEKYPMSFVLKRIYFIPLAQIHKLQLGICFFQFSEFAFRCSPWIGDRQFKIPAIFKRWLNITLKIHTY